MLAQYKPYLRASHIRSFVKQKGGLALWKIKTFSNRHLGRLVQIGGMFPAGNKPFYSRQQHVERVAKVSEVIRSRFFSQLNADKVKEFASHHDLGRMPFVHYLEIFLKRNDYQFKQASYQAQHMQESGIDQELINASALLHSTTKLSISSAEFSDSANLKIQLTFSSQVSRMVYYADKLTGYIEDIILGHKLSYFEEDVPTDVEITKNGLPQVFIDALQLNPALIKRIQSCTRSEFNGIVVDIAQNFLGSISIKQTTTTQLQVFEDCIFDLNQRLRKGVMEPIIFVKQRKDIDFDHLCSDIFKPVINNILRNNQKDKEAVVKELIEMNENDIIQLALSLGQTTAVNQYVAKLANIQSRWKIS